MSHHNRFSKVRGVERLESRCVLSASGLFGGMHGPENGQHDGPGGRDSGGQHFGPAGDFGGPRDGRFDGGRHGGPRGYEPPPPPAFRPDSFSASTSLGSPSFTIITIVPPPQQPAVRSQSSTPEVRNTSAANDLFGSLGRGNGGSAGLQVSALTSLVSFEEQSPSAAWPTDGTLRFLPSSTADDETTEEKGQDKTEVAPETKALRQSAGGKADLEGDGLIELDPAAPTLRLKAKAAKAAPAKLDTSALLQLLRELPLRAIPLASDAARHLREPAVQANDLPADTSWIELLAADVNALATQRPAAPVRAALVNTTRAIRFEANVMLYQALELAAEPEIPAEVAEATSDRAGQLAQAVAEPVPAN